MNIPPALRERLKSLGESPEQFADILESRGEEFFISFLQQRAKTGEEASALYRKWAPKIREYVAACRAKNRAPDPATLAERDRAKLQVYRELITKAERIERTDGAAVIICSIPLIGIPVAQQLWPGEDNLSVILSPEELQEWWKIYQHPEEAPWWWIEHRWNVDDKPDPDSFFYRGTDFRLADDESPWFVTSGLRWGSLAGGEDIDLWSWNGREARYVRNIGVTMS